jgi:hypothetical protein
VRLVGELAQLRIALALGDGERVGRRLGRARGLLLLRRGGFGLQLVVGALDRALDQLAVQRAVDDDRPTALVMPRRLLCRIDEGGRGGVP